MGVSGLLSSYWQNIQESLWVFLEAGGSVVEHYYTYVTFMQAYDQKTGLRKMFIFEKIILFKI